MAAFSPAYGYYDVTAYGATGNGTSDDAPFIQAAEAACEATGKGGIIYFPPGTYLVKSTTNIGGSDVSWQGTGAGASVILADSSLGTNNQILTVGAGVNNVILRDLMFQGNNLNNGTGGPGKDAITFGTSSGAANTFCKVQRCQFYQTTAGPTLHFVNVTDGEVTSCSFNSVGHNNGSNADASITPAVFIDQKCVNVRVHHNTFQSCAFDGVRVKGSPCDVSFNYFTGCGGNAMIDVGFGAGLGDGLRAFGNYIDTTTLIQTSNQGINLETIKNFQLIGNTVKASDGYGILASTCADGAIVGNLCFNNHQSSGLGAGDSGIYYTAASGTHANISIAFIGNVCYDNQSSPTQKYGLNFAASDASATSFTLAGNTFWGNAVTGIQIDNAVLNDNSNVAIANGTWVDRLHETSNTLTGTTTKTALPSTNPSISANSMRLSNGIRIVASGKTTSGSSPGDRTFYLGLKSSGNLMNALDVGSSDGDWQLIAYVINDGTFNTQNSFVQFWYGGSLKHHSGSSTSVDTSTAQSVLLEGQLANSGDSIVMDFLSVERL